ncbi:MAG: hypothetical protein ABSG96_15030 [Terracidiphilus sp.]|jgi:hypothetical protein
MASMQESEMEYLYPSRRHFAIRSYCNCGVISVPGAGGSVISGLPSNDGREIPCLCI